MKHVFFISGCLIYGGIIILVCELFTPQMAVPLAAVLSFTQFAAVLWLLLFWKIPHEKVHQSRSNIIPLADPGAATQSPK